MMKLDDEQLLAACQRNDQRAFRQLYDTYAPPMLGICMRYLHDRDAAQDALHDGFIKVFEKLPTLQNPQVLPAWIKSIMVRTSISILRRNLQADSIEEVDPMALADHRWADRLDEVDAESIVQALQQLGDTCRTAFNLYEVEGYSTAEIALQLDMKESSIRSAVTRARQQLIEILNLQ